MYYNTDKFKSDVDVVVDVVVADVDPRTYQVV